jgi:arsenite methyltransferase
MDLMKNNSLNRIITNLFTLFIIMLLYQAIAAGDRETHRAYAATQRSGNIIAQAESFEDTERDTWQKPDEVLQHLNLKPGDVVADIGAGTGYFTRRFAMAVGPGGQALGLDISPSRVQQMKEDAQKLALKNYKAILIRPDDPGLKPGSVDVVFLCNTYHHLGNRVDYFKRLSRSLKKNGRVVIVDFYKKPLPVGPSVDHKISKDLVLEEIRAAGYHLRYDGNFLPYQYYLEFGL